MALPPNVDQGQVIELVVKAFYEEGEGEQVVSVDQASFQSDADGWRVNFIGQQSDGEQVPQLFEWLDGEGKGRYGAPEAMPEPEMAELDFADYQETPDTMAATLRRNADPAMAAMVEAIRGQLGDASDPEGFREWLDSAWPDIPDEILTTAFTEAMTAARLAGIYEVQESGPDIDFAEQLE